MEKWLQDKLDLKIAQVEKQGHGEVIIKIKNGYIHRVLTTEDDMMFNKKEEGK